MPYLDVVGIPGVRAERTASFRRVFKQWSKLPLTAGKTISGAVSRDPLNTGDVDVLRAGLLMGKITASGKYAPSILGVTTNAEAVASTSIQAAAAVITELVRRIGATGTFKLIGPAVAGGPIVAETVTYSAASGTDITVTALANAFIAGSFICPTDGSEAPVTLIPDGYGVKVTDQDAANADVPFVDFPIGGVIESSQIINWPSDVALRAYIVGNMNQQAGGVFVFDHLY